MLFYTVASKVVDKEPDKLSFRQRNSIPGIPALTDKVFHTAPGLVSERLEPIWVPHYLVGTTKVLCLGFRVTVPEAW